MRIAVAYASVVLIWSTTPLGIKWSISSLSFLQAVTLRMLFALVLCLIVTKLLGKKLFVSSKDWRAYSAGCLGLFPTMGLIYWSVQYIPIGLVAIVFGVYPFFVGLLSRFVLQEKGFTLAKVVAVFIAIAGLILIHFEQMKFGQNSMYGILGVVLATFLFAVSSVWLKTVGGNIEPFRQTTGVLLFTVPAFILTWIFMDGQLPNNIDFKSIVGVAYLSIAGTLLGATLFYYILKTCSAMVTSFISLVTPIIAIVVGVVVEGETLSLPTLVGCLMIVISLGFYQGVFPRIYAVLKVLPSRFYAGAKKMG